MADETQALKFENTRKVLQQFAQEVVEAYKAGLTQYNAIATHDLINSVSVNAVTQDGGKFEVSIKLLDYWKYIEQGRTAYGENYKGHIPPIEAIENWIIAKPIIPGSTSRGIDSFSSVTPVLSDTNVNTSTRGLAWAIATNIAKKGIPAKPILKDSVEASLNGFRERIAEALARDVNETMYVLIGEVFGGREKGKDVTDTIVL